jgi:elongation factor Ts
VTVSADLVRQLRDRTGAGVKDCRDALEQTGGDLDKAAELLREKGLAAAGKRAERETRSGVVELYNHGDGRVGVMVEVNCETDFVGRTPEFRSFAHEIALQVAAAAPRWVAPEDVPSDVITSESEEARRASRAEGKPEKVVEQIVAGRMEKFLAEHCLLRQAYIRDEQRTVDDLLRQVMAATGENVSIRRFARWEVGEAAE